MSDLLNKASLVMIPSGYKEDTVFSQLPQDGSGDLSFTRASNGTRINSAGLVEVCPWNLLEQSETFDNAGWSKNNATVTSNTTTAPNGTTTADTIDDSSSSFGDVSQVVSALANSAYTFSVYAKAVSSATNVRLDLYTGVGEQFFVVFNSLTGVYVTGNGGVYTSTALNDGWFRFTLTATGSGSTTVRIYPSAQSGASTGAIYAWGAQLNIGSTAKPYFPTTDRLNVPRLTYQNGGGGCPSLLLEKQSTNLALYSNALSTAPNIVESSSSTATANVYVSPDGTQNAMRFTEKTANDRHGFYQYTTVTAQTYTASIFTKQTGRRYIALNSNITGTSATSFFDLQTISVVSSGSGHTCSIQDFGNGWMRLIVTFTATAGSRYLIWGGSANGTTDVYAGSTSISQTFYGYQLEASSYPTSYIPTTSSSATRVADVCYKTGISSLIGQSQGFIAGEVEGLTNSYGSQSTIMSVSDGTTANRVIFSFNASTGYVTPRIFKAGSTIFVNDFSITLTQKIKFAIGWGGGRAVCYVNGTQVQETTGLTFFSSGTLTRFGADDGAGSNIGIGKVGEYILGTTNLTNAQLQSLTV